MLEDSRLLLNRGRAKLQISPIQKNEEREHIAILNDKNSFTSSFGGPNESIMACPKPGT